jgi:hypothetical protein
LIRKNEKEKERKKKKKRKIYVWKKGKNIWVWVKIKWAPRFSKVHWEFQGFKIKKIQTHFSNHVKSDKEDFLCVSGSLFAIFTCPPIWNVCIFSPPPWFNIIFQWPFWRVLVRPWEACLVLTTSHL